ncbi:MAG: hypothetical protein LUC90_12195 [Lachnospiraceae bacterium]|nr:hypothetical protein [Lachnospiraceae bacterium]
MANITVTDTKIQYRKMLKTCEIALEQLQWAYLQKQDLQSRCCCGSYASEIDRVIVVLRDGKKEVFQFESMEEAKELLARIQEAKPELAVGYTPENRALYEKC